MKYKNLLNEAYSGFKYETLKSGKVLLTLEERFCQVPSKERLIQLIDCLTDSLLLIPMNAKITEENAKIMKNSKIGEEITLADELRFTPDYLEDMEGNLYIPMFSQAEQADPKYLENFSKLWLHISEVIELYKYSRAKLAGLILDPNRQNIIFSPELIKVIEEIMAIKEADLKAKMKEKKYTYVSVVYDDDLVAQTIGEPSFYYKTTLKGIAVGDKVLVDRNNQETIGIVVAVKIYPKSDVPYPLDKTKDIIKIIDKNN